MRAAPATLLVVSLLILASTGFAQPGNPGTAKGHGGGSHRVDPAADRQAHESHARDWGNLSENARSRGLARAEEAKLFARLTYAEGNATGRFVSFGLDPATGTLTSYAVRHGGGAGAAPNATLLFSRVTPGGFAGNGTPQVHGARLTLAGANGTLAVHNNPTALLNLRGANLTVTFDAAPGVTFSSDVNRTVLVTAGAFHGHVMTLGEDVDVRVTNASLTVATGAQGGGILFAAHPGDGGLATANLHAVRDVAASGRVGGLLTVVNADGSAVTDAVHLGVTMRARNVGQGRANVTVSSDDPESRAVVVLLDSTVVNLTAPGADLTVTLDGRAIPRAPRAASVLEGTLQASWHATNATDGRGGVQVLVHVPGFSEHHIGIAATAAGTTPPAPGVTPTPTAGTPTPSPTGATPTPTAGTPTPTGGSPTPAAPETPGFGAPLALLAGLGAAVLVARRRG